MIQPGVSLPAHIFPFITNLYINIYCSCNTFLQVFVYSFVGKTPI